MTLRFCRCLTCLKQNALYGLLYTALHTSAWQIWQVWFLFFWFYFINELLSWYIRKIEWTELLQVSWQVFFLLTIFRMGLFVAAHGSGYKNAYLHKICHTYPKMMKLGAVIPFLKKIQSIYKSRDTPIKFCWHQHFFTKNQQLLLYQEIQIYIAFQYIIVNSFNFFWVYKDCFNKNGAALMMPSKLVTLSVLKIKILNEIKI